MSYFNELNKSLGDSISYGGIGNDIYLKKMAKTNIYEDPYQVDNHIRDLLKDFKPDKPFLASDAIRNSNDPGGGFGSVEKLNLRHGGARSIEDPYLPDGTFLDFEFTERDSRGTATGPNMRKHYEQQMDRASLIKYYSDDSWDVPEQGISPEKMVSNIKSGQYMFKDRYQNFEESFGSFHNGGTDNLGTSKNLNGDIAKCTMDGTVMNIVDSVNSNRIDAVAILSADPQIAYRHSTPDHRFKIAKYGAVRASQFLKDNDWSNNRSSTFQDHNSLVEINGQLINKKLATLIIDLEGIRDTKQEVAKGAYYGDSYNNQIRGKKIKVDDIYRMLMTVGTHSKSSHENFEGKIVSRYGPKKTHKSREVMNQVMINHDILNSMKQATKKQNTKRTKDIRESIIQSNIDNGIYKEQTNKKNRYKGKNNNRESKYNHHIEEQKTTANYSGIIPSNTNRVHEKLNYEDYAKSSLNTKDREGFRQRRKNNNVNTNEYDQDQGSMEFGTYDKAFKEPAEKYMGRDIQKSLDDDMDFFESEGVMDQPRNRLLPGLLKNNIKNKF